MCYSQISQIPYNFCHKLDQTRLKGEIYKSEDSYFKLTEIFQEIQQKHAP